MALENPPQRNTIFYTHIMKSADMRRFGIGLLTAVILLFCLPPVFATNVSQLRCEYRENPASIDVEKPRLSWLMMDNGWWKPTRNQKQTAYQILVASSEELLKQNTGDCWDSGKVTSDQSIQVEYEGQPLASRMRCYWKVRVWDKDGKKSAWSQPAQWTMGLLHLEDWSAQWITASQGSCRRASGPVAWSSIPVAGPMWIWVSRSRLIRSNFIF